MEPEKQIERAVVEYAEALGWVALKMDGFGKRGIPDRLFVKDKAQTIWIEFKAPDEPLRDLQAYWSRQLTAMGFTCHCVDNIPEGKAIFDAATPE